MCTYILTVNKKAVIPRNPYDATGSVARIAKSGVGGRLSSKTFKRRFCVLQPLLSSKLSDLGALQA